MPWRRREARVALGKKVPNPRAFTHNSSSSHPVKETKLIEGSENTSQEAAGTKHMDQILKRRGLVGAIC